ncbi:E3 ubiquitin-protein ligase TRIM21-like [Girardinichthys multiradiatus]|uniref:E3 ubiquitin-protein ligase TRIM21-like n=1 Tax=Girardinichthys multiradiatus TaxID=208333 RepID=UPI001FABF20D|nr:E3 ubiquitin-protein ligase TRIM21-like [Girardinichthys multiradiatus]
MAAASCQLTEDQFLCCICLEVFTDPVSSPCGHTYCKTCITEHWKEKVLCTCPVCKKRFYTRPELQVNVFIDQMVAQFRESAQQKIRSSSSSSSEQQAAKPGDVCCDICTGTKSKALKSCLVCLVSYCQTHLEPHMTVPGLKTHSVIDPVTNLETRICQKHFQRLEMFCRSDEKFVCKMCMVSDHQGHSVVSLKEEYEQRKSQIGNKVGEMKKFIKKKQTKIQYIRDSVELSNEAADRQKAEGFLVFNNLRQYVDQGLKNFFDTIEEKQRSKEKQAEGVITELEEEISVLMRRSSEVKDLSRSESYLSLLQTLTSFKALHTKNPMVDIHPSSYEGSVFRALVELENVLHEEMRKAKLKLIQRYAVDVTVDPDTAHPRLVLSKDGKQVSSNNEWRAVKDSPKRFSVWLNVLGKQSFSSGMFYFEVQVREKNEWYLGVGCQSMKRKQRVPLNPENGYWTLQLKNDGYSACVDPDVCLHLRSSPQNIGVFVGYDSGVVSFYDVHSAELIYSFTNCSFKEKLYPFFNPGRNDSGENAAPLIITADILTSWNPIH